MAIHLIYFINAAGDIALPPETEGGVYLEWLRRMPGYEAREANTIGEVNKLQKALQRIEYEKLQREGVREEQVWESRLSDVRSNLSQRIASSNTSQYEKDFLREWVKLKDEQRRDKHRAKFEVDIAAKAFFEQREFDKPRTADEMCGTEAPARKILSLESLR